LDKIQTNVENYNASEASNGLRELKDQLLKHKAYIQAVGDRADHDPEAKQRFLDQAKQLDNLYAQLVKDSKTALSSPGDAAALAKVREDVANFKRVAASTAKQAIDLKIGRKEAERRAEEEAKRRREEEEREMANRDEIFRAGKNVERAVREYQEDGSPAGQLVKFANQIALAMQKLSELAKSGSKRDIIMGAREIANYVKEIVKNAKLAAAQCKDPILARELVDAAEVANNFGVQIKIVAAVKASSDDNDPTAKKSLVICCQGLTKSVIETVNVAQYAKLRKKL